MEKRLFGWADWMKQRLVEGKSETEIIPEFQKFTESELLSDGAKQEDLSTYEHADPASMSVSGLIPLLAKISSGTGTVSGHAIFGALVHQV